MEANGIINNNQEGFENAAERDGNVQHLKADGTPDHRYKGQREGADQEGGAVNPNFTHAATGGVTKDGIHLTKTGKRDRRYLENRTLSPEESEIHGAIAVLEKFGFDCSGSEDQMGDNVSTRRQQSNPGIQGQGGYQQSQGNQGNRNGSSR